MADKKESKVFAGTKRFKEAVELINSVDNTTFSKIIPLIIKHLSTHQHQIFHKDEEDHVRELLSFSADQLETVLDASSYIFEQAGYLNLNADNLKRHLELAGINDNIATTFATCWQTHRETYTSKLRDRSFGAPLTLQQIDWRLNLTMGHTSKSKTKDFNAIFNLHLSSADSADENTPPENLAVEFSPDRLADFYDKMERIQEQLDALTGQ